MIFIGKAYPPGRLLVANITAHGGDYRIIMFGHNTFTAAYLTDGNKTHERTNEMTKSIRSYPKNERDEVVRRRLAHPTDGLGHWAAVDYGPAKKRKEEQESK